MSTLAELESKLADRLEKWAAKDRESAEIIAGTVRLMIETAVLKHEKDELNARLSR